MEKVVGTLPINFIINTSKTKRNNIEAIYKALTIFLAALRSYPKALDSVNVSLIKFSKRVDLITKPEPIKSFSLPNLAMDNSEEVNLEGALKELRKQVQKRLLSEKKNGIKALTTKSVIFINGNSTTSIIKEASKLHQMSEVQAPLIITCSSDIDIKKLYPLSDNVVTIEEFVSDSSKIITEWLPGELRKARLPNKKFHWDKNKLQKHLDGLGKHEKWITLTSKFYSGPINIKKAVTIDGNGAIIYASKGPVVTVDIEGVTLKNLSIEVTGKDGDYNESNSESFSSVFVKGNWNVNLENVTVKGPVFGLSDNDIKWRYPQKIQLGKLKPGNKSSYIMRVVVPSDCQLISKISGVDITPKNFSPGMHEVRITVDPFASNTLLNGNIFIITKDLKRKIPLEAYITEPESPGLKEGQVLWEPDDWKVLKDSQEGVKEFVRENSEKVNEKSYEENHQKDGKQNDKEDGEKIDQKDTEEAWDIEWKEDSSDKSKVSNRPYNVIPPDYIISRRIRSNKGVLPSSNTIFSNTRKDNKVELKDKKYEEEYHKERNNRETKHEVFEKTPKGNIEDPSHSQLRIKRVTPVTGILPEEESVFIGKQGERKKTYKNFDLDHKQTQNKTIRLSENSPIGSFFGSQPKEIVPRNVNFKEKSSPSENSNNGKQKTEIKRSPVDGKLGSVWGSVSPDPEDNTKSENKIESNVIQKDTPMPRSRKNKNSIDESFFIK